ncbi:MAG: iron-containing alcohol dehydrogenase [Desulfobacteraceae bacterium]|nr:iron-containing alcohol dehydrogenase [Desulfobacteraceae bacterium]
MDSFAFHIPTKIIFGCNKLSEINNYITPDNNNILIVTDQSSYNLSGARPILEQALKNKSVIAFTEVEENPSFDSIKKSAAMAIEHQAQIVIGLGGGSAMDTAKGTAVLAANKKEMRDYMSGIEFERDPLPIICIPTTSGTGSEVTPYAVFSDYSSHDKAGCLPTIKFSRNLHLLIRH